MARRSSISARSASSRGFTLVELLVVITIIGILVAMLVPAVQYAREMGRRNDCMSHLGQLAKGALLHEERTTFLPSDGWGWLTIGDPDRGYGATQPGGWMYNLLPFIDQGPLHDLGANIPYNVNSSGDAGTQKRIQAAIQMIQTPLVVANCPTRRRPTLERPTQYMPINYVAGAGPGTGLIVPPGGGGVARTDYAACAGDGNQTYINYGPSDPGFGNNIVPFTTPGAQGFVSVNYVSGLYSTFTGVNFICSEVSTALLTGGANNTVLLGERSMSPLDYYNGASGSDNENQYVGMDNDTNRTTSLLPQCDRYTTDSQTMFGSAHAGGCNFAFCDGSVRGLSYNIDLGTYQQLGRRVKTQVVDESKIK